MAWYILWYNPNLKQIELRNVFNLSVKFNQELQTLSKVKDTITFEEFSNQLRSAAKYCFWSKCEYEILVSPWASKGEDKKIDVYYQLALNWPQFAQYTFSNIENMSF